MIDQPLEFSHTSDPMVVNKAILRQILEAQDRLNGFVLDPSATPQKSRELMITQGIQPDDNTFSCEIRRSREEV